MAHEITKITLVALDEALASLSDANASENMDQARSHICLAILALDNVLKYAEAIAYEIEARQKPLN